MAKQSTSKIINIQKREEGDYSTLYDETQTVSDMNDRTDVVEALFNGTFGILNSSETSTNRTKTSLGDYIPQEEGESDKNYTLRLSRSYVTPYLANAVDSATGQLFKTPPIIKENKPLNERLFLILEKDVDFQGSDITEFQMQAQAFALKFGMCLSVGYYYNESGSDNLAAQKDAGARPYLKNVSPRDLLGYITDDNGRIQMIRFLEDVRVTDELMGDTLAKQVRVITPTEWIVFRQNEDGRVIEEKDRGAIVRFDPQTKQRITDRVPCEVLYGRKEGVLRARSVFEDLAWINIHHTQVNSDLSWSNHFSLIPFLAAYLSDEVDPNAFDLGTLSSQIQVKLPEKSKIEWVETSGRPQETGSKHLLAIEDKIQISTMSSAVGVTGSNETATGRAIDANSTSAKLRSHAEALEGWTVRIINLLGSFMVDVGDIDVTVNANKEFDITINSDEIKLIQEDMTANRIDRETYFTEMKRRGIYQETVSLESIDEGKEEDVEAGADDSDDADDSNGGDSSKEISEDADIQSEVPASERQNIDTE